MENQVDRRRIIIFLILAFGLAWLAGLGVYLTGGLQNGLMLAPGIPLAIVLLAIPYMWAPAIAHLLTRLISGEGWQNLYLRLHFRKSWRYWLLGWFLPGILTVLGAVFFFALFPRYFDAQLTTARMVATEMGINISAWGMIVIELLLAMLISPLVNGLATFGEEFGWRAYLLPKLMPLGWKKATLLLGVIWGVWHWPVILMGYEYGMDYAGFPWPGLLLFLWIAFCLGIFLSWMTLRTESIYPAVIGHAAINGVASLAALALTGNPNPLLGPLPVGLIGSAGYALVAVLLFFRPGSIESGSLSSVKVN